MPKKSRIAWTAALAATLALGGTARSQDARPVAPTLEPPERPGTGDRETPDERGLVPLPTAPSRAAAAARGRAATAVLPVAWTGAATVYQPLWIGIGPPNAFGLERWTPYFAGAGMVPQLVPHPFLSPWGLLAYENGLFERYRALWPSGRAADRYSEAALLLQRGDRAFAHGRAATAAAAYRRATQAAPELPFGYLGLGAALATVADDDGAARAFRQAVDQYPAWLALAIDWSAFYASADGLRAAQDEAGQRARSGDPDSRFVAGVLYLFGDRAADGRALLRNLEGDRHAAALLARGPR